MVILGNWMNEARSIDIDIVFLTDRAPATQQETTVKKRLPIASLVELPPCHLEKLLRSASQKDAL
jgi:hypothetical protein